MRGSLVAAISAVTLASSLQAATVLVESFEAGVAHVSPNAAHTTVSANTTFATDGTQSLKADKGAGFVWLVINMSEQQFMDIASSPDKAFSFDYTIDPKTSSWANCDFVFQSANGGWQQVGGGDLNSSAGTHTFTGSFATVTLPATPGSQHNFGIGINSDADLAISIDNIRATAVPEPVSMAGLGLLSVGLMARRRPA